MSRRQTVIGVLGGGQLARMLALAGAPLGVEFLVVDSATDPCSAQVAPVLAADWRDYEALGRFAERIDVATFDFENVPAETADWLAAHTRVSPGPRALKTAQDRVAEKTLFAQIGLATPHWEAVDSRDQLDSALATVGAPAVLKTRRLGYDGKGQFRLKRVADADAAWDALGAQAARHGLILEAFVPFQRELSVIAVRGRDGEFRTWPLTQNWHRDGILSLSLGPAADVGDLQEQAFAHAHALAEALDYVGVFALELFVKDGQLLGNEMAPRVHNSGHWTIEGAHTSQFENHVRAVAGLPLGDTGLRQPSLMFNWIGELPDPAPVLRMTEGHWHDYGKSARPGRKVGHATLCAPDMATLRQRAQHVATELGCEDQVAPLLDLR